MLLRIGKTIKDKKEVIKLKKIVKKKPVVKLDNNILKEDQKRFCKILWEAMRLRWRKLNDYGRIQEYCKFGPLGVVVRMSDKMARIVNLIQKTSQPNNESLRDSAIDLINYSAILVMFLDEQKHK